MVTQKTCQGPCARTLSIEEFHWKSKRRGSRQPKCKDCTKEFGKQRYLDNIDEFKEKANNRLKALRSTNKELVKTYLNTHPCSCGETSVKSLTISITSTQIYNLSTEDLNTELSNINPICRNCLAASKN